MAAVRRLDDSLVLHLEGEPPDPRHRKTFCVSVPRDDGLDWDEIAAILGEAHRLVAPRQLLAQQDRREPPLWVEAAELSASPQLAISGM
jgi:hypothetical protein